ncbi:MAG: lipopolysaccharide biosynthesis protein [Permianibacter sp.]
MSGKKIAIGGAIMVAKRWAVRVLSLISTMILARMLVPADFGLLALALSFSMLFEVLAEFNFDLALIRKQQLDDSHYHTAWTLNVIGNSAIALALALAAPWLAAFAKAPDATLVLQVIALCFFFDGLHNIGMVAWRKQLTFSKEFHLEFWRKLLEVVVAVSWAWFSPSVWALVAGMVAGRFSGLALSYWLHPFRPRFCLRHWRELAGFSSWAMGFNFAMTVAQRTDHFLISRIEGLTSLGFYSNAHMLAALPTVELVMPISRALFPGFSSLLNEPARLRDTYLQALCGLLTLALPMAVGLAFVAEAAVLLLLGQQWLPITPLVQGLAVAQVVALATASSVPLLMALGNVRGLFWRALATLVYRPVLIFLALRWFGMEGVPLAIFFVLLVQVSIDSWLIRRSLQFSIRYWWHRTWRPYAAAAVMALTLWLWLPGTPVLSISDALVRMVIAGLIAAPVYLLALLLLWHGSGRPAGLEQIAIDFLKRRLAPAR